MVAMIRAVQALCAALPAIVLAGSAHACPGIFVHDSQNYDNRGATGALEKVDGIIPKGTRDEIVGYDLVNGRTFFVQLRAYLHDPADIRLKPGCKLEKYE
jgi:hypothetical protein